MSEAGRVVDLSRRLCSLPSSAAEAEPADPDPIPRSS